jgi:ATP-dependent DNA helicase RecQ
VRDEIIARLGLRDAVVLIRGFDRPNLRFSVERFHGEQGAERKRRALVERIAASGGPGIVYVSTRRESEELAEELCSESLRAASYHAGMKSAERDEVQERFMDGDLDVVVATTAFGMGIDKADVRWVFHAEVAESLDAYYQEAGRAGRDGEPAEIVLFYRSEDVGLRRFFAGGHVEVDELAQVLDAVREGADVTSLELSATKLATALSRLEDAGAVHVELDGSVVPVSDAPPTAEALRAAAEAEEMRRSFDRSRVDMMRAYAETDECRRAFILSYFGEPFEPPCGRCDNCEAGRVSAPPDDVPFAVGARVAHGQWGEGVVQRYDDDAMVVLFDDVGYKTLALEVVRERALLTAA